MSSVGSLRHSPFGYLPENRATDRLCDRKREDADDRQNLDKLLAALKGVAPGRRGAQFHCVLVYLRHAEDPTPLVFHGSWAGEITEQAAGEGGFGYDPAFYVPELGRTAAELSRDEKRAISHRGKALKLMLEAMRNA